MQEFFAKGEKMSEYVISCCSTADLSQRHFNHRNIEYICFHYEINGREYYDDLGKSMPFHEFYNALKNGAETKTSQVNTEEFKTYFESFLKQGKDIIHVCLSTGLSGVMNSAMIAKQILEESYPERRIYIVDSLGASSGYGLIMDKLADLRDEGMNLEQIFSWVNEHKLEMHHWFFSSDLSFYIKGGRISKTAGFIGGVLGICPLLNMDYQGRLIPRYKIRSKRKVIHAIVNEMELNAVDGLNYSEKCYISHSGCYDDAKNVANLIEEKFKYMKGNVEINDVGTTIGSHTGPGTVALFFWGGKRCD